MQSLEICVLANNNLGVKLASSLELPTTFDERFKVASVPFFIPDFKVLYHLECYIESFYIIKIYFILYYQNKLWSTFTILSQFIVKNLKLVSFASSNMKSIILFPRLYKFPLKINLLYCFRVSI